MLRQRLTSPTHRFKQHKKGGKAGAAWTSKYKPTKLLDVRKVLYQNPLQAEDQADCAEK